MKTNWKLRVAKIKADSAQEAKQLYLAGSTIPEIMKQFGITKKTFYDWVNITDEEQKTHMTQIMDQNKMGRPITRGRKKKSIQVKDVAKANY